MTDELIRREDALAAISDCANSDDMVHVPYVQGRIEDLPAVTVGVKPLAFEGRNGFWRADDGIGGFYEVTEVYGAFHMCRIVVGVANKLIPYNSKDAAFGAANVEHQRRILAALTPTAVDASQATDPAVNAPDPAAIREALLIVQSHADYVRDEGAYDAGWNAAVQSIAAAIKPLIEKGAAE